MSLSPACSLRARARSQLLGGSIPEDRRPGCPVARSALSDSYRRMQPGPDVALPNGVWWLDKSTHSHDVLYGSNFVVQRPKLGGEGLVPYRSLTAIQLNPEAHQAPVSDANTSSSYFDIIDYTMEEMHERKQLQLPPPSEPQIPGLVLWQSDHNHGQEQESYSDLEAPSHPRRTKAVQYTCKRCGVVSTKLVNPHVWATGSVFARCDGCSVIHKLKDNLRVFHEVSGRGVLDYDPERLPIPRGLPQRPDKTIKVSGVEFEE